MFALNKQLKRVFPEADEKVSLLDSCARSLILGGLTGLVSAVILCPSENVKVRKCPFFDIASCSTSVCFSDVFARLKRSFLRDHQCPGTGRRLLLKT